MMADTTVSFGYGSGATATLLIRITDPPAVDYNSTTYVATIQAFIITNGSLSDTSNTCSIDGAFGHSQISAGLSHASFPTGGTSHVLDQSGTITLEYGVAHDYTFTFTASGIEAFGGAHSVSGNLHVPARPYGPPAQVATPSVVALTTSTMTLAWNGVDNGGDPGVNWQPQVATDPGFSGLVYNPLVTGAPQTATGLTRATQYYTRVRQNNSIYSGAFSPTVGFRTLPLPPNPPTIGSATAISQSGMTINWTAPADDGGAAISLYTVQIATDAGFTANLQSVSVTGLSNAFAGLNPNTQYYFRVRANNAAGQGAFSSTSNALTLTGWHYGVSGSWVDAKLWYGVGGVWVPVISRVGVSGSWVP